MQRLDYNIGSVTKALQIIDLLSRKNGQLSVQALAQELDVSPSNITRLLQTMCDSGFVDKSKKTNRYILSNKFYIITNHLLNSNDCVQMYLPTTYRVAEKLDVTVSINSIHSKSVIMLMRTGGHLTRSTEHRIGTMVPIYCSSAGKVMLSQYPDKELDILLEEIEFEKFQANTITDKNNFRHEIELVRKNGYAVDREERFSGIISVSFPLAGRFAQLYAFTVMTQASRHKELFSEATFEYVQKCLNDAVHKTY